MKASDIQTYHISDVCFGEFIDINGDTDIPREELVEFVVDMLENDINRASILYDVVKLCLEHLEFEIEEEDKSVCEDCGHENCITKYVRP